MVPPAVQQTIRQNVGDGNRIQKVMQATENGARIYMAMISTSDGTFAMIKVSSNGSLIGHISNEDKKPEETEERDKRYSMMPPDELRKQAEKGDAEAQFWMGKLLAEGQLSAKRDFAASVEWLRKSAEQGNARAQDVLGRFLIDGRGTGRNYLEGYFWRALSATTEKERYEARNAVREFLDPRDMYKVDKVLPYWKPGDGFPLLEDE